VWVNKDRGIAARQGLGQVIKYANVSPFYEMDFLSTWSFSKTKTLDDWKIMRDVSKVLSTKLQYVGRNINIIRNPIYHRMAIYESLACSQTSRLIETCQLLMAMNCKQPKDLSGYDVI
jgi:hypothetical protein